MKIADIAQEIFEESGEPSSTTLAAIAYWIRGKVGAINSLLCEDFQISSDTLEIVDCNGEITLEAVAIVKQMYRIYDLQLQINNNMNLLATDNLLSIEDSFGGAKFTKINRNEVAKTLNSIRKDEIEILNKLVGAYKINKGTPTQVAGDDTVPAHYGEHLITVRDV